MHAIGSIMQRQDLVSVTTHVSSLYAQAISIYTYKAISYMEVHTSQTALCARGDGEAQQPSYTQLGV